MATVYILYSKSLDCNYIGSCENLDSRLVEHNNGIFENSFTARATDWEIFLTIENLEYKQARVIERHIKRMKSKIFIDNMKSYPELIEKLKARYK